MGYRVKHLMEVSKKMDASIGTRSKYMVRRRMRFRRIRSFVNEFKQSKFGMSGLAILVFFIFLAVAAPLITPYSPNPNTGAFPTDHRPSKWAAPEVFKFFDSTSPDEQLILNNKGTFEQASSYTDLFTNGLVEEDEWTFIELSGGLGTDVRGVTKSVAVEGNTNDDGFIWETSTSIEEEGGNKFLRVTYFDNATEREPVPTEVANEVGIPLDQRNKTRWSTVTFENGSLLTKDLIWSARLFKVKLTTTFEWKYPTAPKRADLITDLRVLFLDDPNGTFNTTHSQNAVKEVKFIMKRVNEPDPDLAKVTADKPLAQAGGYRPTFTERAVQLSSFDLRVFNKPGTIQITVEVIFQEQNDTAADTGIVHVDLDNFRLRIGPTYQGLLGTTETGEDVYSQFVWSTRVSLLVGILATLFALAIGITVGLVAGYAGGWIDEILMRAVDFLIIMPGLPLLIVLAALLEPSFWNIIYIIAILGWGGSARLIRSQVLIEKERVYVEAARAAGAGPVYTLWRHIFPNTLPLVFAQAATAVSGSILSEAGLSFLGLGDPVTISWGKMLQRAYENGAFTHGAWWYVFFPGAGIAALSISFVLIGYTVQQIVNPRLRKR